MDTADKPKDRTARPAEGRLYVLDGLRFAAAMSVVAYHVLSDNGRLWGGGAWDQAPVLTRMAGYGWLGVELFFMISGFVILWSSARRTPTAFAISRFCRQKRLMAKEIGRAHV